MSNFTKVTPGTSPKAKFVRHNVGEVVNTLTEARQVASDISNEHKYIHRATARVVGSPNIRPYDPIYLDGLPNGMSGYWTVLSVKHVFGSSIVDYYMDLEIGTDVIGDVSTTAASNSYVRNIVGEITNQTMATGQTTLTNTSFAINTNSIPTDPALLAITTTPGVAGTAGTTHSTGVATATATSDPLLLTPPNFASVKRAISWTAAVALPNAATNGAATAVVIPKATTAPVLA